MMHTKKNVWIRIAGNTTRIKSGDPLPWRCYIDPDTTEHPIARAQFSGTATSRNFMMETSKEHDPRGLIAWIRCFGAIGISDNVAHITLDEPRDE